MNGECEEFPRCAVCSEPASQQCSACKTEHYCSRVHQKQAWRNGHRNKCSSFKININDILGRHLLATRDIKQGETILKEKPAVVGPKMVSYPSCLSCNRRIKPTKFLSGTIDYYKCSSCNWPMCNIKCEKSSVHKEECELMTARKYQCSIKYTYEEKRESAYCVILPLRCLLLQKSNPNLYEAITNLQSHLETRIHTPLYKILKANLVTFIQQVLGLNFTEETILNMASIMDTNSFDIRDSDKKARAIYLTSTLLSHDCNPNTKHVFYKEGSQMALIATVPIPKGSIISTSYTQTLWSTLTRRLHLLSVKYFDCTCERCKDPTEYETYLGSVYCSKCNPLQDSPEPQTIPKMISTNPMNNAAEWKCEKCTHTIPAKSMIWGNESMKKEIKELERTPKAFEEFIDKYKQALHPTNSHIVEVKYALTQLYGYTPGFTYSEMNDAALNRKITLCEELLDILSVLRQGHAKVRGELLLELQAARVIQTKRDLANTKITKQAAQGLMGECMMMLQEAASILSTEPDMQQTLKNRLEEISNEIGDDY